MSAHSHGRAHDTDTAPQCAGHERQQRRAMIVTAALPLVAGYGTAVTTGQIARAAGIGEGTVFRAFAGKEELPDTCLAEAMNPGHALRELASSGPACAAGVPFGNHPAHPDNGRTGHPLCPRGAFFTDEARSLYEVMSVA